MARLAMFAVSVIFVIQLAFSPAQAQTFSRGVPASAMSPEPDGRQHGVPASVLSPVPPQPGVHTPGVHGQRQFGNQPVNHGQRRRFISNRDRSNVVVPVPVFYPVYGYGDPSYPVADPYVSAAQQDASTDSLGNPVVAEDLAPAGSDRDLQEAYLQGARDALSHERDKIRSSESPSTVSHNHVRDPQPQSLVADDPKPAKEDNSPATVFIFKDGHQIETRNFAIVGQTLYDLSGSGLKKVQLTDMDKDATTKANDDRGISVKLP